MQYHCTWHKVRVCTREAFHEILSGSSGAPNLNNYPSVKSADRKLFYRRPYTVNAQLFCARRSLPVTKFNVFKTFKKADLRGIEFLMSLHFDVSRISIPHNHKRSTKGE
jgi:hypothetical protein